MSDDTSVTAKNYPSGRCRAISQAARRRCRGAAGRGPNGTLCSTHAHENAPVTIDSDPVTLIRAVSAAYPARCRAIEHDGAHCTTGCGPTDRFCALHKTISVPEVTGFLDEGELDVVLIKRALSSVQTTDAPRAMTDGGRDRPTERSDGVRVTDERIDEYLDQFAEDHHEATVQQRDHIVQDFVEWCRSEADS